MHTHLGRGGACSSRKTVCTKVHWVVGARDGSDASLFRRFAPCEGVAESRKAASAAPTGVAERCAHPLRWERAMDGAMSESKTARPPSDGFFHINSFFFKFAFSVVLRSMVTNTPASRMAVPAG